MGVVKDISLIIPWETVLVNIYLRKDRKLNKYRAITYSDISFYTECSVGYIGNHCSLPCPYPSYGKGCQMLCNCRKDECIFNSGCEKKLKGIYVHSNVF